MLDVKLQNFCGTLHMCICVLHNTAQMATRLNEVLVMNRWFKGETELHRCADTQHAPLLPQHFWQAYRVQGLINKLIK